MVFSFKAVCNVGFSSGVPGPTQFWNPINTKLTGTFKLLTNLPALLQEVTKLSFRVGYSELRVVKS